MKRVRFAEEEATAVASMDDDDDEIGDDEIAAAANDNNNLDPCGDPYSDIRSAEAHRPASNENTGKTAIPLEPFNMAAERREGLVDARGNLIPFDERNGSGSRFLTCAMISSRVTSGLAPITPPTSRMTRSTSSTVLLILPGFRSSSTKIAML